jgi:hypothetical protein
MLQRARPLEPVAQTCIGPEAGGILLIEEADLGSCMAVDFSYPETGEWSDSIHKAYRYRSHHDHGQQYKRSDRR